MFKPVHTQKMIVRNVTFLVPWVLLFVYVKCTDFDLGNAIDLLQHYGVVAKMLPIGADDPNDFIQQAFSSNVLNKSHPINENSRLVNKGGRTDGLWKLNLCYDAHQLLASFFDNYSVEMVKKAEKLLFSTWMYKNLEFLFGLSSFYLTKDYIFLLIRQEKCVSHFEMGNLPKNESLLNSTFQRQVENITTKDPLSTYKAFVPFGTHFVRSFSKGDVLYQVLVYSKKGAECFKTRDREVTSVNYECASSSIIQTGKIKSLSNSPQVEDKLNETLNEKTSHRNLPQTKFVSSLLNLKKLGKEYIPENINCESSNTAIIGFNLSSIHNVIFNRHKSSFVQEMIDNQMSLRDMFL